MRKKENYENESERKKKIHSTVLSADSIFLPSSDSGFHLLHIVSCFLFFCRSPANAQNSTFYPILAYGFVGETNSALQLLANGIEMCILISRLNKSNGSNSSCVCVCAFFLLISFFVLVFGFGFVSFTLAIRIIPKWEHFTIFNQQNYSQLWQRFEMENWDDIILLNFDFLIYVWCDV